MKENHKKRSARDAVKKDAKGEKTMSSRDAVKKGEMKKGASEDEMKRRGTNMEFASPVVSTKVKMKYEQLLILHNSILLEVGKWSSERR